MKYFYDECFKICLKILNSQSSQYYHLLIVFFILFWDLLGPWYEWYFFFFCNYVMSLSTLLKSCLLAGFFWHHSGRRRGIATSLLPNVSKILDSSLGLYRRLGKRALHYCCVGVGSPAPQETFPDSSLTWTDRKALLLFPMESPLITQVEAWLLHWWTVAKLLTLH